MQDQEYPISMKIIHWTMALIILSVLAVGFYMTNFMDRSAENRMSIYNLHKSFGVLILFLVAVRIFFRLTKPIPPLPDTIDNVTQCLSNLAHIALYVLMIAMPISGYLMSTYFGYPVHFFGIQLPMLVGTNPDFGKFFAEAHEFLAFALLGVIALHIAGVIKHRFFDIPENDVLKRMT